jgi:hypothetical protein
MFKNLVRARTCEGHIISDDLEIYFFLLKLKLLLLKFILKIILEFILEFILKSYY